MSEHYDDGFDLPPEGQDDDGGSRDALKPGWYDGTITDAEWTEASTGTRQLKLRVDLDLPDGDKYDLWCWIAYAYKGGEPIGFGRKRITQIVRATGAQTGNRPDPEKMPTQRIAVKLKYKKGDTSENDAVEFRKPAGGPQTSSQRRIAERQKADAAADLAEERKPRGRYEEEEIIDEGPIDDDIPFATCGMVQGRRHRSPLVSIRWVPW